MKVTIELGKELAFYANKITNIFTTKDYLGRLQDSYKEHVMNFYVLKTDNDFTNIYKLKKIILDKSFTPKPCSNPLADLESARGQLEDIVANRKAYRQVISILMKSCKGTNEAGGLIHDLLSVLKKSSKDFHETALKYDRYMGNALSVADVLKAIHSYGELTGLVDFYNLEEGKDG